MGEVEEDALEARAAHYRERAKEALARAAVTSNAMKRQEFFRLASSWHDLALRLEIQLTGVSTAKVG
jgi:hypothetical protein